MKMEVVDRLATPPADIEDQPIAVVRDAMFPSEVRGDAKQSPEQRRVAFAELCRRLDVPPRHEEDVRRGSWRDVADRDEEVVLMDPIRGDLAGHDPAEQAAG